MSEVSFPGPGQDGEQPPPGESARNGARQDGSAEGVPEDDWDPDAEMAAFIADLEAGRARIPEEWEIEERPPATISLGDAADVDLAELAAMLGPDGLGGEIFAQDRPADVMRPGPVLAALTERAAAQAAQLTDNQLLGAMSAARRLAARAEYLEFAAVAEFTRRREQQYQAAKARKVPAGRRPGEFADAELAMELVTSANAARDEMMLAGDLATRLPATSAALAAGMIDGYRARIIWRHTRFLTNADAATADQVLAEAAPHLRYEQLARKAIATAMKLDPEAMTRGKDQARADRQRVEARREETGNASLSGRELAIEDVLASKAHIDALAVALRRGGMAGSLRQLRVLVYLDLTQGRDPLHRLTSRPRGDDTDGCRGGEHGRDPRDFSDDGSAASPRDEGRVGTGGEDNRDDDDWDEDDNPDTGDYPEDSRAGNPAAGPRDHDGTRIADNHDGGGEDDDSDYGEGGGDGRGPGSGPDRSDGPPAPLPALINLIVPAGTLLGWSSAPGDAGGWDLTDPDDTRRLVAAASAHPRTRWCLTLTGPDGSAIAHGCARGPHLWTPGQAGGNRDGPGPPDTTATPSTTAGGPDARQTAALADLLRRLNVTLTPIARGTCDHRNAEDRYVPSRKLGHLVRARTATCPAPGCGAQAHHSDLDHTIPHPDGSTDECNLAPPCRRHHRAKQAPGWQLSQPEPGVMRWQTPSGRVCTTRPTAYET